MSDPRDPKWLTSKEVLLQTGISRATLNNYIKLGIIPRPVVKRPESESTNIKKIGYFPETVIETIKQVKRLKQKGIPMDQMSKQLSADRLEETDGIQPPPNNIRTPRSLHPVRDENVSPSKDHTLPDDIKLTVTDIPHSAYLVNRNFEIEWINPKAEAEIFGSEISSIVFSEARNIFKLFFQWTFHEHIRNWKDLLAFHMGFVKRHVAKKDIPHLYEDITQPEIQTLERSYDEYASSPDKGINRRILKLTKPDNTEMSYEIYTVQFREGTLFIYVPENGASTDIERLLTGRENVISNLLDSRLPSLVSLCVLVADLQDSVKISAELPPAEYFELINGLWQSVSGSFDKYQGIYGKHSGDGILYYFLKKPNTNHILDAIHCALELRNNVKDYSNEWKMRKGWLNELYLNVGINEGKEFFGTIKGPLRSELTALGDSINYAGRLSDFARYGGIIVTKNTLTRLTPDELKSIRFGIRRKNQDRELFIENTFSRVLDLLDADNQNHCKYQDISTLPVTEIVDLYPTNIKQ